MSNKDCNACRDLQDYAPEFALNGVTTKVAKSLQNNTGFNSSLTVLHDDCEDLNDANDCLIGNMEDEIEAYEMCDWKDYMRKFVGNLYEMLKAIIAAICGLWLRIEIVSYQGILKLWTDTSATYTGTVSSNVAQVVHFSHHTRSGNLPASVLKPSDSYSTVTVKNTIDYPILVNATFNSSIYTVQNFACCYIVVTRDGNAIGQTPFIAPNTYDQQVQAEPFILQPGEETVLGYYFAVGLKNEQWFMPHFGKSDGSTVTPDDCVHPDTRCVLDAYGSGTQVQGSYFIVQAQTIIE